MTALNQLIIGLLLVVVTANIGNVNGGCTPIKLNIKAEYLVSSLLKDYKHTRDISSSTAFQRNFDSLDVSAAVSGSYGGFSASASASFSEVSEAETSNSKLTDKTRTTEVTYSEGQNHIVEKITKTVTINGRSKTLVSREIKYPVLVKDTPSPSKLRQKGEEYIQYNYGGIRDGKIRRNTYEATACIEEPCEDDNRVFPFSVTQKEAQGFEVNSFGFIPTKCDSCRKCTQNLIPTSITTSDIFCQDARVKLRCKKSCGLC